MKGFLILGCTLLLLFVTGLASACECSTECKARPVIRRCVKVKTVTCVEVQKVQRCWRPFHHIKMKRSNCCK